MQAPLTFAVDNRLPEILDRTMELFPKKNRDSALPALEQVIFGIIARGLPTSAAMATYRRLRSAYPSLAALRDAKPSAIQMALIGIPAAALKAAALRDVLRQVEAAFGSLSLDALAHWEADQALRFLMSLPRVDEDIAWSVLAFCGQERTVLNIDKDSARPVRRLGLAERGAPLSALPRQVIERSPADWRGEEFSGLSRGLSRVADRFCHQGRPDCASCPLRTLCPSAERISGLGADVITFPAQPKRSGDRAAAA